MLVGWDQRDPTAYTLQAMAGVLRREAQTPLAGPHQLAPLAYRQRHARQLTLQLVDNIQRNGPVVAGAGALEARTGRLSTTKPDPPSPTVAVDQHQFTSSATHTVELDTAKLLPYTSPPTRDVVSTPRGVAPTTQRTHRRSRSPGSTQYFISPRICGDVQRHRHRIAFALGEGGG